MGPAHRAVAGEELAEALVKLSLNESDEGGRHVLLYHYLCSKTVVYFFRLFQEWCDLEHCWVVLLRHAQDCHNNKPLL